MRTTFKSVANNVAYATNTKSHAEEKLVKKLLFAGVTLSLLCLNLAGSSYAAPTKTMTVKRAAIAPHLTGVGDVVWSDYVRLDVTAGPPDYASTTVVMLPHGYTILHAWYEFVGDHVDLDEKIPPATREPLSEWFKRLRGINIVNDQPNRDSVTVDYQVTGGATLKSLIVKVFVLMRENNPTVKPNSKQPQKKPAQTPR